MSDLEDDYDDEDKQDDINTYADDSEDSFGEEEEKTKLLSKKQKQLISFQSLVRNAKQHFNNSEFLHFQQDLKLINDEIIKNKWKAKDFQMPKYFVKHFLEIQHALEALDAKEEKNQKEQRALKALKKNFGKDLLHFNQLQVYEKSPDFWKDQESDLGEADDADAYDEDTDEEDDNALYALQDARHAQKKSDEDEDDDDDDDAGDEEEEPDFDDKDDDDDAAAAAGDEEERKRDDDDDDDDDDEEELEHHRRTSQSNTLSTNTATITDKSPIQTNDDDDGFDDEESLYSSSHRSFSTQYKLTDDDHDTFPHKKTFTAAAAATVESKHDDDDDTTGGYNRNIIVSNNQTHTSTAGQNQNQNQNQARAVGIDENLILFLQSQSQSQSYPHLLPYSYDSGGMRARSASADAPPSSIPPHIAVVQGAAILSIPTRTTGPSLRMSSSDMVGATSPDAVLVASEQSQNSKLKHKKISNQPKSHSPNPNEEYMHKKNRIKKMNRSKVKKKQQTAADDHECIPTSKPYSVSQSQSQSPSTEWTESSAAENNLAIVEAQSLKSEGFVFTAQYL